MEKFAEKKMFILLFALALCFASLPVSVALADGEAAPAEVAATPFGQAPEVPAAEAPANVTPSPARYGDPSSEWEFDSTPLSETERDEDSELSPTEETPKKREIKVNTDKNGKIESVIIELDGKKSQEITIKKNGDITIKTFDDDGEVTRTETGKGKKLVITYEVEDDGTQTPIAIQIVKKQPAKK